MTPAEMKTQLAHALGALGVEIAGHHGDHMRWSATDLATDLAPLLSAAQERSSTLTHNAIFPAQGKCVIQNILKHRIVEAIQSLEDGLELDDICYVLTEQLVYWQLMLFKHLNDPAGGH